MKNYILHYARLNEDSETFGFETFKDLEYFVYEESRINRDKAVYLKRHLNLFKMAILMAQQKR